ncbi:MAG: glycosyltransferase family 4 protein [Anaerolineae bacterium]|nr:glycosyltransferase family 4 protein [Anaerolineae bacterium]
MHILHVTHRAWPAVGGSERYVHEIARRQVLDGHRVTVLATDADDLSALWDRRGRRVDPGTAGMHQGVSIRRLPVRHLPLGRLAFPALRWLSWGLSHLSDRPALALARFSPWLPGLTRALREAQPDLLFAWNITLEGLTAAVAREAAQRQVPWLAVPVLHLGRLRFYTMPHQLNLLRQAGVVLAQTPSERAFLLSHDFAPDQVRIVSPGVNLAEGCAADGGRFRRKYGVEGPLVLSLAMHCYEKGTHHLLAAAQRLWRNGERLTLALLGPQDAGVRRLLARLPPAQRRRCIYPGEVPEAEKWDALDAADVVAMPSCTESFGIVFLEGWMREKPVVGARSGAIPDVIDEGQDGLLVPFGDVAGLCRSISALLDDPALAARMGRRGLEKVERFYTWDRQYGRLSRIVDAVVGRE